MLTLLRQLLLGACMAITMGAPPSAAAQPAAPAAAPLVVMNRQVFVFRAPWLGFSPADRAQGAQERVETLLGRGGPGIVSREQVPQGALIKIDDGLAFLILPEDADALKGATLESTAVQAAAALSQVIGETRELRNVRQLLRAGAVAAGWTLAFLALLWLLARARRAIGERLVRLAKAQAHQLHVGGVPVLEHDWVIGVTRQVLRALFWALALLLTYEWIGRLFGLFPYTRAWGEQLNGFLIRTVAGLVRGIVGVIPELIVVLVIVVIARAVTLMLNAFLDRVEQGRIRLAWLDAETVRPTRKLAVMGVWLLALVMVYPYLPGASTDAFKGVSVLIGLMVSIGGASVVGQALSGTILMYTRMYRVGEYVRIGEHEGTVVELGMYQTRVRTGTGEEITLPNSMVLGTPTLNFSRSVGDQGFVLDTALTIGYDTPWRQVHAMLEEAARRTEGVKAEPAPRVYQTALSDFYVEYRLVMHAVPSAERTRPQMRGRLHQHIQDLFNEHGVQIMSPHYIADPTEPKVVAKARWFESPAAPPP